MVTISNLSVAVGDEKIINSLSLDLQPGTFHVLMGPNGSGKSSLAYTLMGHPAYQIMGGTVTIGTTIINDLSPDKRAKLGLFLAFQQPLEIPGVMIGTFLKEAYQAIKGSPISIKEFQHLVAEKLAVLSLDSSILSRSLHEGFSGGERKKLEVLQMLVLSPAIVILDEIDSGLDVDALKIVAAGIAAARTANPAMIILLITHYQRILDYLVPDYVHVLAHGTLVASGDNQLVKAIEVAGYEQFR
jgi:Fe-S cluster assembly ATP-binding protein